MTYTRTKCEKFFAEHSQSLKDDLGRLQSKINVFEARLDKDQVKLETALRKLGSEVSRFQSQQEDFIKQFTQTREKLKTVKGSKKLILGEFLEYYVNLPVVLDCRFKKLEDMCNACMKRVKKLEKAKRTA